MKTFLLVVFVSDNQGPPLEMDLRAVIVADLRNGAAVRLVIARGDMQDASVRENEQGAFE